MESVVYLTCTELPCIGTNQAPVVLCIDEDITLVSGNHTLPGFLLTSEEVVDDCSCNKYWRYTISYDPTLIVTDEEEEESETLLVPNDIIGLFCETCFTDWLKELIVDFDPGCAVNVFSYEDLLAAAEGDGSITVCVPITLEGNVTVNAPIRFGANGRITTGGFTLTLNGTLEAPSKQIFVTSGTEVILGAKSTEKVLLEWFGAVGDGVTDDTAAVQLAISRAAQAHLTVTPLVRTYLIDPIVVPRAANIITLNPKRSSAKFLAKSAGAMFTITGLNDAFVTFEGISFDSNALATAGISIISSDNIYIRRCDFSGVQQKGISINAGIFIHIDNNEFLGSNPSDSAIYVTGFSAAVYINRNNFGSSSQSYGIYADASWVSDTLHITYNTFGNIGNIAAIRIEGNSGVVSVKSLIRGNRVDQGCSMAHIVIGRYAWQVEISANSLVDPSPYNILTDAGYTGIYNNWLAQATVAAIGFTTNANNGDVGLNLNNGGLAYVVDTSTYNGGLGTNRIQRPVRKSTTADRGNGLVPTSREYGTMYLDTTLDPDGKPIWWNGVAWIDATGAVV